MSYVSSLKYRLTSVYKTWIRIISLSLWRCQQQQKPPPTLTWCHDAGSSSEQILSRIRRMESDEEPSSGTGGSRMLESEMEALHNTNSINHHTVVRKRN